MAEEVSEPLSDHRSRRVYLARPGADWNEHRMFRTAEKDVHIHIYSAGCGEIQRNLTFRDRLRRNSDDRCRYERTKRELAAKQWPDMDGYANAKTEVIESIIAAAEVEGEITR